jgi:hypothetical protein
MDPLVRLRCLRKARYACHHRDPSGRRCLARASRVVLHDGKHEARCTEHEEQG